MEYNYNVSSPLVHFAQTCVFLLLFLFGAAFAASPKPLGQRIVGGSATTIQEYPYMSNMQLHVSSFWWTTWCGGSLITTRSVLSAAHCFEGHRPSQWRVRLGSSFANSGGSLFEVSQLILHKDFNSRTKNNDIAIVRLANPATLGSTIGVARIPASDYILPDGTKLTAVGWGTLTVGGWSPEQLHHVDTNIINQQRCSQRYTTLFYPPLTDGTVCSGIFNVGGKDSCHGDFGGPLTYKAIDGHVVYAISSWSYRCADPYYPGVNARLSYYSNWIVANGST